MLPKFLLAWYFNKPILMNNSFGVVSTSSLHKVPHVDRYENLKVDSSLNVSKTINQDGIKLVDLVVHPDKVKIERIDNEGRLHLTVVLEANDYESRTLWGTFGEAISKWKRSIDNRKISRL